MLRLLGSRSSQNQRCFGTAINKFLKNPLPLPPLPTIPKNLQLIDENVLEPELPFTYEEGKLLTEQDRTIPIYYGPFVRGIAGDVFPSPLTLSAHVFQTDIRPDIMQRVIRWQRALWQQGTHKAKTKAEVSGTGRKPWAQKGTGRARQGSLRNPHFKGGGISHGPVVRSHAHLMNRRERRFGLRSALATRFQESQFFVCTSLNPNEEEGDGGFEVEKDISQLKLAPGVQLSAPLVRLPSGTRKIVSLSELAKNQRIDFIADRLEEFCAKLNLTKVLIVDDHVNEEVILAIKKIDEVYIDYQTQDQVNVYEVLHKKQVLISRSGLRMLEQRLDEVAIRKDKWKRKGFVEFLENPEKERIKRSIPSEEDVVFENKYPDHVLPPQLVKQFDARFLAGKCIICSEKNHHSSTCVAPKSAALWSEAEIYFGQGLDKSAKTRV